LFRIFGRLADDFLIAAGGFLRVLAGFTTGFAAIWGWSLLSNISGSSPSFSRLIFSRFCFTQSHNLTSMLYTIYDLVYFLKYIYCFFF
jgi:hypothetical protein